MLRSIGNRDSHSRLCMCVSANQTLGAVFTGSQVCRVNCSIVHHCCQRHLCQCRCFVFIEPANAKTQWLEFSAKMSYYTDRDPEDLLYGVYTTASLSQ